MSKYHKNYFSNITKESYNKNIPFTPHGKRSLNKESNILVKQKNKNYNIKKSEIGNIKTKKNFKLYSSSILDKKNNIEYKNNEVKMKDIKSFSNSREFKSYITGKNAHLNEYHINFSNKNQKKKTDHLFFFEDLKLKKTNNKPLKDKNPENQNKINKTQSFINNNISSNSHNYIINAANNAKNSSVKKNSSKTKSRPSSLLLQKKLKEEKKVKNKAKPMTLLRSSKEKEKTTSNYSDSFNKKNFQINTTNINYYNNCQISNSNYFLKNNVFFNKTCTNDIYNNNIIHSEKNQNPIILKEKIIKYKKDKNKEIKKSQSQSHIFHQKSQNMKTDNLFINTEKKKEKIDNYSSTKKISKNKATNFNLNINNINNYNNKFLFSYNNLNKSSSDTSTKTQIINVKFPYEENKKIIYYNETNNFQEELSKEKSFIQIINLWNKLGGINDTYKELFIQLTKDNEDKNIILENEISELSLILNILNNINENIKTRNELLDKIKTYRYINDTELNEVNKLLCLLSKITINIIKDYYSFMKEISFDFLLNKYNLEKINNFNTNYLSQMEIDCNFLLDIPYLNNKYNFKKNIYWTIFNNEETNHQINLCKLILFKNKIYQKLFNNNDKYENNPFNNNKLNLDNYLSKNNIANNIENNKSNNNSLIKSNNSRNVQDDDKNISEVTNESKMEHKIECDIPEEFDKGKKVFEIYRNDLLYNSQNFNCFTFGRENKYIKLKKDDNFNLTISPYNPKKDAKLSLLYISYLSNISEKMKLSFNINKDIYYYINIGIFPKILLFKDLNSNVKAFCILSYVPGINPDKKILMIANISCMNDYKLSIILLNLVEYCKNNDIVFDSIELDLYYIKKEGKYILDKEYENEIKSKAKFKWVKLDNDGEKRKIKYHYVKDSMIINKEININNINSEYISNNSNSTVIGVNINNYSLIKYYKEIRYENIIFSEYSQLFPIINLLKNYYLLNNNNEIEQIMNNFEGIKLKKIIRILSEYCHLLSTNPKDFKNDFINEIHFNLDFLHLFLEIIDRNKKNEDDLICLNFFNIFTSFSSILKIEINGYEYNIISMNNYAIEVFNINNEINENSEDNYTNINIYDNNTNLNIQNDKDENSEGELLYFIKSEKENLSFIFYELKEKEELFEQNKINLIFNKVLRKILVKDNQEPIKSYNKICIPSFKLNKINSEKDNLKDKMDGNLKLIDYELLNYIEEIDFCLEKSSNNDVKFSFPLIKNVEDINDIKIIKNSFVIAVINDDLVLDYCFPAMNIFYVNKNVWIKIEK